MSDSDEVQFFDIAEALEEQASRPTGLAGHRVEMATSPNCYVALMQTRPRAGETHVHSHPDSDQILFVLTGDTVEGLSGQYVLKANQGVLVPGGVNYGFTNNTNGDLQFLSLRTESPGGRRIGYVPSVPSDAMLEIPEAEISAKGMGRHLYLYALDERTIGVSPLLVEEWNRGALLRMNCEYERRGEHVVVSLPERMARWYEVDDLAESHYRILADAERTRVRIDLSPILDWRASRP